MLSKEKIRSLHTQAMALEPVVRIGKNGITQSSVDQVRKVLERRGLVKVKLLRSFVESNDRKDAAAKLAEGTRSQLISQVGFTVVLFRQPVPKKQPAPKSPDAVKRQTQQKQEGLQKRPPLSKRDETPGKRSFKPTFPKKENMSQHRRKEHHNVYKSRKDNGRGSKEGRWA